MGTLHQVSLNVAVEFIIMSYFMDRAVGVGRCCDLPVVGKGGANAPPFGG